MECTKPNCECIAIAEFKNGNQPVKNYECLPNVKLSDVKKNKIVLLEKYLNPKKPKWYQTDLIVYLAIVIAFLGILSDLIFDWCKWN